MSKSVKIYSTSTCHYCHRAKDFLKEKNIAFENIDVGANPDAGKEMMDKSGQMGVPVLDIDGKIIVGFDKEAISEALGA
ncbi:glutaredoxin family protein [Candidatus Omnitrophota bacterium]